MMYDLCVIYQVGRLCGISAYTYTHIIIMTVHAERYHQVLQASTAATVKHEHFPFL